MSCEHRPPGEVAQGRRCLGGRGPWAAGLCPRPGVVPTGHREMLLGSAGLDPRSTSEQRPGSRVTCTSAAAENKHDKDREGPGEPRGGRSREAEVEAGAADAGGLACEDGEPPWGMARWTSWEVFAPLTSPWISAEPHPGSQPHHLFAQRGPRVPCRPSTGTADRRANPPEGAGPRVTAGRGLTVTHGPYHPLMLRKALESVIGSPLLVLKC